MSYENMIVIDRDTTPGPNRCFIHPFACTLCLAATVRCAAVRKHGTGC
jgi:hypothetical protein